VHDAPGPLSIVGDGPQRGGVTAAAARSERIHALGRQERADIASLLKEHAVLLFPSIWREPFGIAVIEAFACARPVFAADHGVMRDLVSDGQTGRLFPAGDARALADLMQWATDNPSELEAMGRAARVEYETKYTAAHNYERLLALFNELLA
jgi:glycosyltransferase involved in cell wall biosynthesis